MAGARVAGIVWWDRMVGSYGGIVCTNTRLYLPIAAKIIPQLDCVEASATDLCANLRRKWGAVWAGMGSSVGGHGIRSQLEGRGRRGYDEPRCVMVAAHWDET